MDPFRRKRLAVVLCTFNGEKYIEEQLNSIISQIDQSIDEIFIFDDSSDDSTIAICKKYPVLLTEHEHMGFSANFLTAIQSQCLDDFQFIALADQDNFWFPDRIERVFDKMTREKSELYVGSALNTDTKEVLGYDIKPNFPEALFENRAMGCNLVFTQDVRKNLGSFENYYPKYFDWWIHLISISSLKVTYDIVPTLGYRIHEKNAIGVSKLLAKIRRNLFTANLIIYLTEIRNMLRKLGSNPQTYSPECAHYQQIFFCDSTLGLRFQVSAILKSKLRRRHLENFFIKVLLVFHLFLVVFRFKPRR